MNRRSFLQLLGLGTVGAALVKAMPITEPQPLLVGLKSIVDSTPPTYHGLKRFNFLVDSNCPPDTIYFMPKPKITEYRRPDGTFLGRHIELNANQIGVIKNLG